MPVVTGLKAFLNEGEVEGVSFDAEEKATAFVPLTLALRGRGLHWHDSNSCKWLRKFCVGSKNGSTRCCMSNVPVPTTNESKQTCIKNIGGGFGRYSLGEHDYRIMGDQWAIYKMAG